MNWFITPLKAGCCPVLLQMNCFSSATASITTYHKKTDKQKLDNSSLISLRKPAGFIIVKRHYAKQARDSLLSAKVEEHLKLSTCRYNELLGKLARSGSKEHQYDLNMATDEPAALGISSATSFTPLSQKEMQDTKKEVNTLSLLMKTVEQMEQKRIQLEEISGLMESLKGTNDNELKQMAEKEFIECRNQLRESENEVLKSLLPKDSADDYSAILEVRAGTGGQEASLFAAELFGMYESFARTRGWKFERIGESISDLGGFKEASASIEGDNVFGTLKFEMGVHRVQRVPLTEGHGRLHTSTVTVAILPEPSEVDMEIRERDLKFETMKAGGAGGQHVNKTESAIRVTHIPSGIAIHVAEDRSQHKNRAKALQILRARLFEIERIKLETERKNARREQIGTGSRSERIRTYNFQQDRVTDHRVNLSIFGVEACLQGEGLDEIIHALRLKVEGDALEELVGDDYRAQQKRLNDLEEDE